MNKYNSYKDSGVEWIGNVPSGWDNGRLGFYSNVYRGSGYQYLNQVDDDSELKKEKVVRISDISDFNPIRCEYKEQFENYRIKPDNILIGGTGHYFGKSIYVTKEMEGLIHSYNIIRVVIKKQNSKYIQYWLSSSKIREQMDISVLGSGQPFIDIQGLKDIQILIPPLSEQHQIVSFLDTKTSLIDSLIEKTQQKIELLKEKRTSLIDEVVTKGLNPNVEMKDSGVEWIGEIPSHWELPRLNNLGDFSKGKGITKDKIKESGHKCIRCGEIYTTYELRFNETNSFIDDETSSESVLGFKGVLLFTGDGESLEEIGKCVVYEGEEELYIGGGINVFTPKQEKVIPIYLSYVMSSESVIFQKSRQGKGEIVVHIYSKQLKEIRLGLPPFTEQQQIVEYLDEQTQLMDKSISIEEKRIELLKEYRQSLISEVVTGKRKVV